MEGRARLIPATGISRRWAPGVPKVGWSDEAARHDRFGRRRCFARPDSGGERPVLCSCRRACPSSRRSGSRRASREARPEQLRGIDSLCPGWPRAATPEAGRLTPPTHCGPTRARCRDSPWPGRALRFGARSATRLHDRRSAALGDRVAPGQWTGTPQIGNQRVRSGSMVRSSASSFFNRSSTSLSLVSAAAGTKG